jgi:hypothetical protein
MTITSSARGGYVVEDVGDQVAAGVDDDQAIAVVHVVADHVCEQGGFPYPGGADDPQVPQPV